MPCSVGLYPSINLPGSTRPRQYDTELILGRIQAKLEEDSEKEANMVGITALDYRLRREERRRRIFRSSSLRSNKQQEEDAIVEEKKKTVVKDRLGNEIYIRGETSEDKTARELEQWLKKMKSISTNVGLEHFKDIKVGVYQSEVAYGSPSLEPYPDLKNLDVTYSGGKDNKKAFHGKGNFELEDGSCVMGYFIHGIRQGDFKVESRKGDVCFITGEYKDDKLNGKSKVYFKDDTMLEGYFKDGVLHGFCRHFDAKNRLTFVGMYRNGKPFGTCWKIIRGGGCVVGLVDEEGRLTGQNISYLYPDFKTALVGSFRDGVLHLAQKSSVCHVTMDNFCIKVPHFHEPEGRLYRFELSNYDFVTSCPCLPDPYESNTVEVKESKVPGANEGLFAKRPLQPNTVIAFYNGIKVKPKSTEEPSWEENGYKIFDPAVKDGTVDIPVEYRSSKKYCASLAHKTNHSFIPNSEFMVYNHPRFGIVPCIVSKHYIAKGEEIFVRYGYELDYCPDWYLEAWEKGNYPVPDSMKSEYSTAPSWAQNTTDDRDDNTPNIN